MHALDMRIRTAADIRQVEIASFFDEELPSLIRTRGSLATPGAIEFAIRPTTFFTPAGAWTLAVVDGALKVTSGDVGETALEIGQSEFADFVNDLGTLDLMRTMQRVRLVRGSQDDVEGWWAVVRSLLDQRPMFTRGSVRMLDSDGGELDVSRSFTPQDDDAEIGYFLAEAGFLHLSGWFDPALMDEIAADMDRELGRCTEEDGSWWALMADGRRQPIRISHFADRSDALQRLMDSPEFHRIRELAPGNFSVSDRGEALQKPIGVVKGINALPWHHDCTLGMHSYRCCEIVVGISVTGAGPGSSQLSIVPGSHRALMPYHRFYPETGLEPLAAPTRKGDVTVHCSCTLHMSADPTEYERKVVYFALRMPCDEDTEEVLKALQSRYRDSGAKSIETDVNAQQGAAARA